MATQTNTADTQTPAIEFTRSVWFKLNEPADLVSVFTSLLQKNSLVPLDAVGDGYDGKVELMLVPEKVEKHDDFGVKFSGRAIGVLGVKKGESNIGVVPDGRFEGFLRFKCSKQCRPGQPCEFGAVTVFYK